MYSARNCSGVFFGFLGTPAFAIVVTASRRRHAIERPSQPRIGSVVIGAFLVEFGWRPPGPYRSAYGPGLLRESSGRSRRFRDKRRAVGYGRGRLRAGGSHARRPAWRGSWNWALPGWSRRKDWEHCLGLTPANRYEEWQAFLLLYATQTDLHPVIAPELRRLNLECRRGGCGNDIGQEDDLFRSCIHSRAGQRRGNLLRGDCALS